MSTRVLSLGEALIDVVIRPESTQEHVGGSLLNVAVGIATLGQPAGICAFWGKDDHGALLRDWAESAGVEIVPGTDSAEKTPVAFAHIDDEGHATYDFDLTWEVPQVPDLASFGHLHTGSIGATLEPGGSEVLAIAGRMREHGTVSYDPNIRPALMKSPDAVMDRVEHLVALVRRGEGQRRGCRLAVSGHPRRGRHAALGQGRSGDGGGHPRSVGCLRPVEAQPRHAAPRPDESRGR